MSDEDDDDLNDEEEEDEDDEESGEGKKGGSAGKGKMMIIIGAAAVVVLVGGGAGAYFAGLFDSLLGKEPTGMKMASIELGVPVIHDLPLIKADLKTGRCRAPFLKTVVSVELGSNDLARLQAVEARITDGVRTYLRDQERQDMVGKQGTDRLRFDITRIINNLIAPAKINAVIFKEFLVQ